MSDETHHNAIEAVASQAKADQHAKNTRGFVIVKWMDRYSYFLTPMPQASLEKIVNSHTRAEIVARYSCCVDGEWVRLPLEASQDGSSEERVDGLE